MMADCDESDNPFLQRGKRMKAYVLHGPNDIRYEEVSVPSPAAGEVLIEVKATGVCGSDIPRIYQTGAHKHPLIPGHEFSGIVAGLGKGVEEKWLGKRVGIFPLIPCGKCGPCQNKQYEMCRSYDYVGSRRDGAYAEYVTVPADNLIELPDNVSFEAAAMLEPMAVAVHAMRRVSIKAEDTVIICGVGTIGTLLLMFLMDTGLKSILVIGNKDSQKQNVLRIGLDENCYCDSKTSDVNAWIMEKTNGKGADVFFECVGRNETITQAVDLTAPAGQICLVGNPYSDMELDKQVYWKILRNQIRMTGTWNSSFTGDMDDDWHYVLDRLALGTVAPEQLISHRFSIDEIEKGFYIMRDKIEDYVKIMMVI